ncbi:MAG: hypothetical protein AAFU73_17100 [Planctomycetota bacterium]
MPLLLAALALAAQQPAQSTFPLPPGPTPDEFGVHLAIDGDRALVGMLHGDDAAIWSYQRSGAGWIPEAPFPAEALADAQQPAFVNKCLELHGDVALVGYTATELTFDGAAWVVTDQLLDVTLWDADLESGVAIGLGPVPSSPHHGLLIVERGPSGWETNPTSTNLPLALFTYTDMAIEGDVAVVGDGTWWAQSHFAWDGAFSIVERDPATGNWSMTERIALLGGTESLLGSSVDVSLGTIYATRELPNRIEVYDRTPAGNWEMTSAITHPVHPLHLPSPGGSFEGAVGSNARPEIVGRTVFAPFSEGLSGPARVGRFERDPSLDVWEHTETYDVAGYSACLLVIGDGDRHGTIAPFGIDGSVIGPAGALMPVRGPDGCLEGVAAFEPSVSGPTCVGRPTSLGSSAELELVGSFRRDDDRTTFVARGMPPGVLALPLFSQAPGFTVQPGGSAGDLCIGQPITRLLHEAGPVDGAGAFSFPVDVDGGLLGAVVPVGTPTYWQLWFRDFTAGGQPTSNFTNGAVMRAW